MATSGFYLGIFPGTMFARRMVTLWLIKVLTTVSVLGSGGMLEGALVNDSVTAKQLMLAETCWFSD